MNAPEFLVLTILKTSTLLLGVLFSVYAWRAYRRTRLVSLLSLSMAIGLITVGVLIEGASIQLFGIDPVRAHELEALFQLAGFAVLVSSLLSHKMRYTVPAEPFDRETQDGAGRGGR